MALTYQILRQLALNAAVTDTLNVGVTPTKLIAPPHLVQGNFVVAKFKVAAGATLTLGFNGTDKLTEGGTGTSGLEKAGGITFTKMCGFDVVVARTAAGSAIAGAVTVDPNNWFGSSASPASLSEGDQAGLFVAAGITPDRTNTLVINASSATNLEAHVLVYGLQA